MKNFRLRRCILLRSFSFGRETKTESRLLDETGHLGEAQRGLPLSNKFMLCNPGILVVVICLQGHNNKLKKIVVRRPISK